MSATAEVAAPPRTVHLEQVWRPRYNPWVIALTVTLATFMEVLDTSIANVALPHIAGNLSASTDESTWVLTSYLVSNAIVLPMSGWISNRIGRKRFYMTCVALFGISSLLCGIAPSLGMLVFFRVLQGIGGGGLAPSEQAILADTFSPRQRGMAFALYGLAVVLAPAIGPTLGGFITDNYSWRWIFLINLPVAALSLFLTSRLVEDPPWLRGKARGQHRIDYIGLGLIAVGLGGLQVVLDKGERLDWFQSPFILWFTVIAVAALIATLVWEYFHDEPIIDIRLFRNRTFALSCGMMFILGLALFGTTVLLPQLLQTLMGYSAQNAGMVLSPGGITVLLLMPVVGILVTKLDARYLIAFGFLASAVSLWYMTGLTLDINYGYAVKLRVFQSIGIAFLFVPINTMSYAGVDPRKSNEVSGMTNLMRNMGGSVGISLVETMLAQRSQVHQSTLSAYATPYNPQFRALTHGAVNGYSQVYGMIQQQAAALAYLDTLKLFAALCLIMVPLAFFMKRQRPGKGPVAAH
ncbi:MAG TPA: EmrB/QacA family drug resistance transporter [Solibacterales bacterium]|nr:EmrB/QacA family drug resistance transporter [Bryobacterales bacterium]